MTCRRLRTPSCRAPRGQRRLAMISSAAQQSGAERELTADCFNKTGKHCCGGGLLLERRVVEGCVRATMSLGISESGSGMLWGACSRCLGNHCRCTLLGRIIVLAMSRFVFSGARPLLQCSSRQTASYNTMNWSLRKLATAAAASGDAPNLPLAGIKVLDMTRVLAGVR